HGRPVPYSLDVNHLLNLVSLTVSPACSDRMAFRLGYLNAERCLKLNAISAFVSLPDFDIYLPQSRTREILANSDFQGNQSYFFKVDNEISADLFAMANKLKSKVDKQALKP